MNIEYNNDNIIVILTIPIFITLFIFILYRKIMTHLISIRYLVANINNIMIKEETVKK